jgi:hypothetical protein
MIWGQGDGSGLRAVDSRAGRIGQLACWEHYNPLARYALMADGEQIHSAMYPGSIFGDLFAQQTEVNVRQHALESACFVVCATAWLDADQQAQIMNDTGCGIAPISGGCFTAIVAPDGTLLGNPLRSGEGEVIADLDFSLIDRRKQLMDSRGHYSRPEPRQPVDRPHAGRAHPRAGRTTLTRPNDGGTPMSKLFVALIACTFASLAAAQTAAPKPSLHEQKRDLQAASGVSSENSGNTQAAAAQQARNVKASKEVPKLSKEERAQLAKDSTRRNVNPENSSGTAATAAMQRQTTAQSKATSKQNTEFKSKEGRQQLDEDLQKKSTP